MTIQVTFALCLLVSILAGVCLADGAAPSSTTKPTTRPDAAGKVLLFDGTHPLKSMPHVKIADDPFVTSRPDAPAPKVLKGGPLGPEEAYQNKGTFPADHFVMPESGKAELIVVVAMKGLTDLKVEVWGKNTDGGSGGMKFRKTLPAEFAWQTVVVPIDATKIKPGATVYDITIFQVGKDKDARLFIQGVWVVKK